MLPEPSRNPNGGGLLNPQESSEVGPGSYPDEPDRCLYSVQDPGSPQLENGYTRIANEIVEQLAQVYLTGAESKVLWVIFRKTYGWNKKSDKISFGQFAKMTGMSRPNVARAVKGLLSKRIIGVIQVDNSVVRVDNTKPRTYWFQKDYTKWERNLKVRRVLSRRITGVLSRWSTTKDTLTKDINTVTTYDTQNAPQGVLPGVTVEELMTPAPVEGGKKKRRIKYPKVQVENSGHLFAEDELFDPLVFENYFMENTDWPVDLVRHIYDEMAIWSEKGNKRENWKLVAHTFKAGFDREMLQKKLRSKGTGS